MTATATVAAVIPCPGSGQFVHEDHVDGNYVTTCPTCGRFTLADPLDNGVTNWLRVHPHRPLVHPELGIHGPGCDAATTGLCTCGGSTP
jgi:hypothetical protein